MGKGNHKSIRVESLIVLTLLLILTALGCGQNFLDPNSIDGAKDQSAGGAITLEAGAIPPDEIAENPYFITLNLDAEYIPDEPPTGYDPSAIDLSTTGSVLCYGLPGSVANVTDPTLYSVQALLLDASGVAVAEAVFKLEADFGFNSAKESCFAAQLGAENVRFVLHNESMALSDEVVGIRNLPVVQNQIEAPANTAIKKFKKPPLGNRGENRESTEAPSDRSRSDSDSSRSERSSGSRSGSSSGSTRAGR